MKFWFYALAAWGGIISGVGAQTPDTLRVTHKILTTPVAFDADDPALWIHPTTPESSIVLGIDKGVMKNGGLYVWDMNGALRQQIPLTHPNNVDVRTGLHAGAAMIDIAAVSIRDKDEIRVFKIDPATRLLTDVTAPGGIAVFDSPYGLALYRRPSDGMIFAMVSSKNPQFVKEIWQLRLTADSSGSVKGVKVRAFGEHEGIVEGMVADDELGYFYYAEGERGIHKFYADPRLSTKQLAFFATDTIPGWEHKGLALYKCSDSTGYLLVASPDDRSVKVFRREGDNGNAHQHSLIAVIVNPAQKDGVGVEVSNWPTSAKLPRGVMVWQDEIAHRYRLYAWEEVAQNILTVCPPRRTQIEEQETAAPIARSPLLLRQNYPNPFNPQTTIVFELAARGTVSLAIYDFLGREVRTLRNEALLAGVHAVQWDGKDDKQRDVASGIYICRAECGATIQLLKLMLMR